MLSNLFPIVYGLLFITLLWQAFRVMGRGFNAAGQPLLSERNDRTGRRTIHPELLDGKGRLTQEDLLTVRFDSEGDLQNPSTKPGE